MKILSFHFCKSCGKKYYKGINISVKSWNKSKFCSLKCINTGRIPYNKGRKMPDTYIHPMLGKHHTLEARLKIKAKRAKQIMSPEHIKKWQSKHKYPARIIKNCVICGKQMSLPPSWSKKLNCSSKCYAKYQSIYRVGKLAGGYINGKSFEPYNKLWTPHLRQSIRKRDNFTCQICKKVILGTVLNVHHINYIKEHSYNSNLISLCTSCHSKTNRNRNYWLTVFTPQNYPQLLA